MSQSKTLVDTDSAYDGVAIETYARDVMLVELTVIGTGAVSARAEIFGSITGLAYISLGVMTASGTDLAIEIDSITAPYRFLKADIASLTGNRAVVTYATR